MLNYGKKVWWNKTHIPVDTKSEIFLFVLRHCLSSSSNHHHHLQGLSLLAHSVLNHQAILMAFLSYVFLSVGNMRIALEPFLMVFAVDVQASSSTFRVFVFRTSSFLVMTSFRFSFPCPAEYKPATCPEAEPLLLPVFFHLFF
jgi:hypothetical protein